MKFSEFLTSESGAVTTDYVFWLSASAFCSVALVSNLSTDIEALGNGISETLASGTIVYTTFDELRDEERTLTMALATPSAVPGTGRGRGDNGWGNGDQDAPGNSDPHNNAENSTRQTPRGLR